MLSFLCLLAAKPGVTTLFLRLSFARLRSEAFFSRDSVERVLTKALAKGEESSPLRDPEAPATKLERARRPEGRGGREMLARAPAHPC